MNAAPLLAPFEFAFFRNGLAVATLAGALCGLIGVYVVLKGMSYIGHGLSHAIFGGFAASALLGVNVFLGAGAWGVASALLVNGVARRRAIGSDAAIGVVTTASFAVGLALLDVFGSIGRNPDSYLFGNVLGVSGAQVLAVSVVTVVALAVVVVAYRPLLFSTFDPEVAAASGVATSRVDGLLVVVLAAAILATMNVLGVTLVAASIVIPPTVARLLTASFSRMLVVSTAVGAVTGFVGMNLSYHLDVPSGPMIVLTGSALFAIAFVLPSATRSRSARARRARG